MVFEGGGARGPKRYERVSIASTCSASNSLSSQT